jgi:hypothetical protein
MKNVILFATVIFFYAKAGAQKKHAVVFNSYNAAGFVAGKLPVTFAAQTENGIQFKHWFIGAGFGIDNYYRQTLPLFGAIKKEFPLKVNSLFLYANAGGNLVAKNKEIKNTFSNVSTKGGLYLDAGIGYKIKAGKSSGFYFSLGNTLKELKQTEASADGGFTYTYLTENKFSRISFKMGFQF